MRCLAHLLIVVLLSSISHADPPPEKQKVPESSEKPTSVWMEKKMEYSQDILRGLAMKDFEKIEANAKQMRLLSKVEGFVRGGKPNYRTQLHVFERVCDEMVVQADKQNLQGVTLAFNQLTISCVSCHETLRTKANHVSTRGKTTASPKKRGDGGAK